MTLDTTLEEQLSVCFFVNIFAVYLISITLCPILFCSMSKVKADVIVLQWWFILTAWWLVLKIGWPHWTTNWILICFLIYRLIFMRRTLFANSKCCIDLTFPITDTYETLQFDIIWPLLNSGSHTLLLEPSLDCTWYSTVYSASPSLLLPLVNWFYVFVTLYVCLSQIGHVFF